ncbi:hypothetical protein AHAS_Ahas15G0206400 [Arachis hypogaea]
MQGDDYHPAGCGVPIETQDQSYWVLFRAPELRRGQRDVKPPACGTCACFDVRQCPSTVKSGTSSSCVIELTTHSAPLLPAMLNIIHVVTNLGANGATYLRSHHPRIRLNTGPVIGWLVIEQPCF